LPLRIGTASELSISADRIVAFYLAQFQRRLAVSVSEFYDWQFLRTPAGNSDNCIVALDEDRNKIAGVLGVTARPFHLIAISRNAAELTTWLVADDYRSTGVGASMITLALSQFDALVALGVTDFSIPVFLRSGFRQLRAIPRFTRIFDIEALATIATISPLSRKLAPIYRASRSISLTERVAEPEDFSGLFDRMDRKYNFFVRDPSHLLWRYRRHPVFSYRIFHIASGDGEAMVVVRDERSIPGLNILHVVDCIGDDEAMPGAFSFIDTLCTREDTHMADFFCTADRINKHAIAAGWFSALDDTHLRVPHLFHPVSLRDPSTTSLVYWSRHNMTEMSDRSCLYVTKQDIDFDRPVPNSQGEWT
jgi:hypothetical protein